MQKNNFYWPKLLSLFLFVILFAAYANIFAVFTPGQTLDPNCAPGAVGCTVSSNPVVFSNIQDINTNKLVGRSTAGSGSIEEISLGSGLSLAGGVLSSSGGSSPVSIVNSSSLFSTGLSGTGTGVATAIHSIFLGENAGNGATSAEYSNFFGESAGYGAVDIFDSNFIGEKTGYGASDAFASNFLGQSAGYEADGADNSNFIGAFAGYYADGSDYSNFIGNGAGYEANGAGYSNFIGLSAGYGADNAYDSNFIGDNAGESATNAYDSNFFGMIAGSGATNAYESNFLGSNAGKGASEANSSIFIGDTAGANATNANNSIFLGTKSGGGIYSLANSGAINAANSIFIGQKAGYQDTVNNTANGLSSILLGSFTNTGGFSNSILLGSGISGSSISNTKANQFMLAPSVTEMRLRGVDYTLPSSQGAASSVLTNDGSGGLTWAAVSGGSQTLQQTLDIGGSLNKNNAIDLNGNILTVNLNNPSTSSYGVLNFNANAAWPQLESSFNSGVGESSYLYQGYDGFYLTANKDASTSNYFSFGDNGFDFHSNDLSGGGAPQIGFYSGKGETGFFGGNLWLDIPGNTSGAGYVLTDVNGDGYATWQPASGGSSQWTTSGSDIYFASGKVGIGTTTPTSNLSVKGSVIYSSELVTNGTFDSDASGWSLGYGAVYNSGKITTSYISGSGGYSTTRTNLNINVEAGKSYVLNYTISDVVGTDSLVSPNITSLSADLPSTNIAGTHTEIIYSDYTGTVRLEFARWISATASSWSLDNVSLKEIDAKSPIEVVDYNNKKILSFGDSSKFNFFVGPDAGFGTSNLNSTFIGYGAGYEAVRATWSNFVGEYSGYQATDAMDSNFMGEYSGYQATYAGGSNFLGPWAGYKAENVWGSNFIGYLAGSMATEASDSNFIGEEAGENAANAWDSNFIGPGAGGEAINSAYSNFIGYNAGYGATNARNSIFIGQSAGQGDTVSNMVSNDDFSILIGKSTGTGGFSNSIALGGSAVNTASNQFMIGSATRPIDTTRWNGSASTQCTLTTGTGIACTSDERLKTNITDLPTDTLDKLTKVKTVNFNWLEGDNTINNIGFLAQDLEQYFPELVATDSLGFKSVYYASMTPILTEAIRELDLKVKEIDLKISGLTLTDMMTDFYGGIVEQVVDGVKGVVVGNLKVGSPTKRTGITLYDEVTGDPYCLSIANGQTKTIAGECPIISVEETIPPLLVPEPIIEKDTDESTDVEAGTLAEKTAGEVSVNEVTKEEVTAPSDEPVVKTEEVKSDESPAEKPAEVVSEAPQAPVEQ